MICEQKILYDLLAKDLIRFVSKRSDMICLSKRSDMICKQNVCKQTTKGECEQPPLRIPRLLEKTKVKVYVCVEIPPDLT